MFLPCLIQTFDFFCTPNLWRFNHQEKAMKNCSAGFHSTVMQNLSPRNTLQQETPGMVQSCICSSILLTVY